MMQLARDEHEKKREPSGEVNKTHTKEKSQIPPIPPPRFNE